MEGPRDGSKGERRLWSGLSPEEPPGGGVWEGSGILWPQRLTSFNVGFFLLLVFRLPIASSLKFLPERKQLLFIC